MCVIVFLTYGYKYVMITYYIKQSIDFMHQSSRQKSWNFKWLTGIIPAIFCDINL